MRAAQRGGERRANTFLNNAAALAARPFDLKLEMAISLSAQGYIDTVEQNCQTINPEITPAQHMQV
jgi:hypothetical protein